MLSQWHLILECWGSNMGFLLTGEIQFKMACYVQELLVTVHLPATVAITKIQDILNMAL